MKRDESRKEKNVKEKGKSYLFIQMSLLFTSGNMKK